MDDVRGRAAACLAELDAPDAERTLIAPSPVLSESRPHRARARASRAAAVRARSLLRRGRGDRRRRARARRLEGTSRRDRRRRRRSAGRTHGVGAYDPFGDNGGARRGRAATRPTATRRPTGSTEHYNGRLRQKPGVGLVLDAGRAVALKQHDGDDRHARASRRRSWPASSPTGPFTADSSSKTVDGTTIFTLNGQHRARTTSCGSRTSARTAPCT